MSRTIKQGDPEPKSHTIEQNDPEPGGKIRLQHGLERSDNYFARFRLAGDSKWRLKSTGTANLAEAEARARDIYWEHRGIMRAGGVLDSVTFGVAAKAWLADFKVNTRSKHAHADYTVTVERYLTPYFDATLKKIWEISELDIHKYRTWRRNYWTSGPGSLLEGFNVTLNGKTRSKKVPKSWKKEPSDNTIRNEDIPLKKIFEFARLQKWITQDQIPPIVSPPKEESTRTAFDPRSDHLDILLGCVDARIDDESISAPGKRAVAMSPTIRFQRKVFKVFVNILLMTGIRPGEETRPLKWRDLTHDFVHRNNASGNEQTIEFYLNVRTSKRKNGKESYRAVAVPFRLFVILNQWRDDPDNKFIGADDYILCNSDGTYVKSFNRQFCHLLDECGLTKAKCGIKYEPYSLRHTFATINLAAGVDPWVIAKSMGHADIEMLKRHYGQDSVKHHYEKLAAVFAINAPDQKKNGPGAEKD